MSQAPAHPFESLDHMFILHALKAGLAGVLALFVAEALRLQYPEWSVFTVLALMMVHYCPGSIALKSLFRFVGALVGASWLAVALLERLRLARYVENVSLFFIALAVLLAGLADWLVNL